MLSVFPQFLSYWMFVPLFLRLTLGLYFFHFGYEILSEKIKWEGRKKFFENIGFKSPVFFVYAVSAFEITAGVMLMMGLLVQVVAIVLAVLSATIIAIKTYSKNEGLGVRGYDVNTYILLLIILLSLVLLGPGYFAMDLPL